MNIETQLRKQKDGSHQYREGYFLSIEQLEKLARDFSAVCYEKQFYGVVSDDREYIEKWIKELE